MLDLDGVFLPVPACFTDDGSQLSEIRIARYLRRLLEFGAEGFVVGGEASEYQALTFAERKHLLEIVAQNVPPGTRVIANITSQSTAASISLAQHAGQLGARGSVCMPPFGMSFSDIEIADHFHRISQYGHLPLVIVDPMGRLDPSFLRDIHQIPGAICSRPLAVTEWARAACFEHSALDEFSVGELFVVPIGLFGIDWRKAYENESFDALRELIRIFGVARALKSAEDFLEFDLGPLRGPQQPIPRTNIASLQRLFELAA